MIERAGQHGLVIVALVPEHLVHETAATLRLDVLRALAGAQGVVLDMSSVALISSIGVATLLELQERCKDAGQRFVLAALPPQVRGFLEMLHLAERFERAESVADGVGMIDSADG